MSSYYYKLWEEQKDTKDGLTAMEYILLSRSHY